jgi:uncharacterized protein
MSKRIILAGGSGFLGQALAKELLKRNHEVVVLTRSSRERSDGIREVKWDGEHIGEWIQCLDGAEAVVNLAGRSVNCRHTPENIREINGSRVNSVQVIAAAFDHIKNPPRVWVQSGSLALYGDTGDRWCDEDAPAGQGGAAETCKLWEGAFNSAKAPETRKVLLRIGFVLDRDGGALSVLGKLARWFLGGAAGNGRQYISWVHLADMTRMFLETIERENLSGAFNATAANPATNAGFMCELRRALHRPWSPPAPVWAVHFGSWLLRTEPSLALTGRRCTPKRFLDAGFKFQFSELRGALADIYQ